VRRVYTTGRGGYEEGCFFIVSCGKSITRRLFHIQDDGVIANKLQMNFDVFAQEK